MVQLSSKDHAALWVDVDLGRISRNVSRIAAKLEPGCRLLAVVKANGYGHGDAAVASAAVRAGASWLGVARVQEGKSVRDSGIDVPVLMLAEPPGEAIPQALDLDLTPTIYTAETAGLVGSAAQRSGVRRQVHIKIDTGMHRYGVQPETAVEFFDKVASVPGIEVAGVWTHFAVAEDVLNPFTKQQFERFMDALDALGSRVSGLDRHMANSAGILTFPEAHLDMARAGIITYGIYPSQELRDRIDLEPALEFRSRVGQVKRLSANESLSYGQRYTLPKPANVATVPCGYADGLTRALSNAGSVLIGGRRRLISGTITMDHFLVDVGDDPVAVGDEVVMIGGQGDERVTAQEIASVLGTIPYEVVCAISARVPRFYAG